ncbi:MAG TPA: malto-oligosyltrehalose trehalohydrolase [Acidimicrobiales bacterium]|jgi:maltooligosyltrehalose trehalohydrolase
MTKDFSVWAPAADRVDLVVGDRRTSMARQAGDWWHGVGDHVPGRARYGFALDGGPVRPDPRSPSQPDGVEGLSEVVDHRAFDWADRGWRGAPLRGALLYELHVGTFTPGGTFDTAIERLPHLVDLGVDAIELLPVAEFPGDRGWGYDGVDLFAPHHAYGGPDGLKRLVDASHRAGIGVVVDVVYNHLGPAGNHLAEFGPYFSERHRTNWGPALNLDGPGSDEVRRFVIDNALMWLRDYHADGLRLDAVHALIDNSARHVLEELAEEVDALATEVRRPLFLIAESDLNDPRFVRSRDAGGYGFDAAWADEWHHAVHATLSGERSGYYEDFGSLAQLAKALRQAWVYDGQWSPHRRRAHGRPPTGLVGHQFVVSTQNHDQVGNRAVGDRPGRHMSTGRLRVAAALLLTGPFIPMLFQGEEWGATTPFAYFTDLGDPGLAQAVTEGRRHEFAAFGWEPDQIPDPQALATFDSSKLSWAELDEPDHLEMLDWYRRLVTLRRQVPDLADPRLSTVEAEIDEAAQTVIVRRGTAIVLVNLGTQAHAFARPPGSTLLAASDAATALDAATVTVPSDAAAIVTTRP